MESGEKAVGGIREEHEDPAGVRGFEGGRQTTQDACGRYSQGNVDMMRSREGKGMENESAGLICRVGLPATPFI